MTQKLHSQKHSKTNTTGLKITSAERKIFVLHAIVSSQESVSQALKHQFIHKK